MQFESHNCEKRISDKFGNQVEWLGRIFCAGMRGQSLGIITTMKQDTWLRHVWNKRGTQRIVLCLWGDRSCEAIFARNGYLLRSFAKVRSFAKERTAGPSRGTAPAAATAKATTTTKATTYILYATWQCYSISWMYHSISKQSVQWNWTWWNRRECK